MGLQVIVSLTLRNSMLNKFLPETCSWNIEVYLQPTRNSRMHPPLMLRLKTDRNLGLLTFQLIQCVMGWYKFVYGRLTFTASPSWKNHVTSFSGCLSGGCVAGKFE